MSIEAFLAWEATQVEKHFLHRGEVYAMAGAGRNHGSITPALSRICGSALRSGTCRYRDDDTKVIVPETGSTYFPDGMIACPPNYVSDSQGIIDNPTVIFEVLSPSTKDFDREGKFDAYGTIPSLREYVLIHSEIARVEVFTRPEGGKWTLSVYLPGTDALIESVGIALPLSELYEEVEFAPVQE